MKKFISKLTLLMASSGLLVTSGILAGKALSQGDDFVDPIVYADAPAKDELMYMANDEEEGYDVDRLVLHYHNEDGKNDSRVFYVWITGVAGKQYEPDVLSSDKKDMQITLDFTSTFSHLKNGEGIYFIIKYRDSWNGQSDDTFVAFEKFQPVDKQVVVWTIPGVGAEVEMYHTEEETKSDKVLESYFTSFKTIHARCTAVPHTYRLYSFDQAYLDMDATAQDTYKSTRLLKSGKISATSSGEYSFDISLTYFAHINVQYVLETEYPNYPGKVHSSVVGFHKLYEAGVTPNNPSNRFTQYYNYNGDDLGVTYTPEETTFKLWAPTSGTVSLNIYNNGTNKSIDPVHGGSFKKTYKMSYMAGGVWAAKVKGDLNGKYYTYTVQNSAGKNEVVDPYAHACGANGMRGMILDFDAQNPENWDAIDGKWDGKSGYDITTPQQLSIYESHVRDLTIHETWTGTAKKGTYAAYAEKGTTYSKNSKTVKTGFDHVEELGVNAIQFTPIYDIDNAEISQQEDSIGDTAYNWGYNPLNYNCLEGQYSTDPTDGAVRVREFKNLVYKLATNANKTRVIMDVVYNHVFSASNSNFMKIMPRYYFRYTDNVTYWKAHGYPDIEAGSLWNGSGCGNEVKTEAPMMSKFIVDSLCWWAKEYNVKGFRFDLMGLIDYKTLQKAATELYKIDPDIVLYGEGWTGDGNEAHIDQSIYNTWGANTYVTIRDLGKKANQCFIGCFNNGGRDALKGGNDRNWIPKDEDGHRLPGYGFMSQGTGDVGTKSTNVAEMMLGKNCNADPSAGVQDARRTVNYASCHDNYSLFDQFSFTLEDGGMASARNLLRAVTSTNMAIMMSNGIAFMQGGEELFRTKIEYHPEDSRLYEDYVEVTRNGKKVCISHNAYMSSDATNGFDYSRKISVTYGNTAEASTNYFEALAKVIKLRRSLSYQATTDSTDSNNYWGNGAGSTVLGYYVKGASTGGYILLLCGRATTSSIGCGSTTVYAKVGSVSPNGSTASLQIYSSGVLSA